jgi:hypothetical protein
LGTTFTSEPVVREKLKKNAFLNFGQVHDAKKTFDDPMSELRLRQNISLGPLKNS